MEDVLVILFWTLAPCRSRSSRHFCVLSLYPYFSAAVVWGSESARGWSLKTTSACITWHCFANQGSGWSCDPFLVPCFVEPIFSRICISVNKWVEHLALISTKAVDAHMYLMVPCFVAPTLFDNSCLSRYCFFCCIGALFVCLTFLYTCTNIRCLTCVSMRLDLPGHFVT